MKILRTRFVALLAWFSAAASLGAQPLTVTVPAPKPPETGYFKMGTAVRPDGRELTVDSLSLRVDGRPWLPVMGEFHFSRYPQSEWRDELLKMRAGGIDIVATYVFWIHHEEEEGVFDWSGQRDLRKFIETAQDAGLAVVVRCGPWCHGEVRNGGLPDWLLKKGWKVRSDEPAYLEKVRTLYSQIAQQVKGLLWKDGGPVAGIQLENEYGGLASHLMTLKGIARAAGLDAPLYTRTGWPNLRSPMPLGEMLPLYGSYADGFWERDITPMPGENWNRFLFPTTRIDTGIGADLLGKRKAEDAADAMKYPFLTCELGGGMLTSYHRRVLVDPRDVEALALLHVGAGSNLPGYYMYHGGTNPEGKLSTLQESQATAYPNDTPVKTYDFQAPLGEYGQTRPHYHLLRRLHLFLHDFGPALTAMAPVLPDKRPESRDDLTTLRWAVRSNGTGGLVFVNNYQRLQPLPPKQGVQFAIRLPNGTFTFPDQPVTVPADRGFFWPFNFDLGPAVLTYATAQPICQIDEGDVRTVFFTLTPGVPAEFVFEGARLAIEAPGGKLTRDGNKVRIHNMETGRGAAIRLRNPKGAVLQVVLLDEADSLAIWKGRWAGRERVFLTGADLSIDGNNLRLRASRPEDLRVGMLPAPARVRLPAGLATPVKDPGVFSIYAPTTNAATPPLPKLEQLTAAGPARAVKLGTGTKPVAVAPDEAEYAAAAVWRVRLPDGIDLTRDPILRVHYVGDVARATIGGKLITDNFYNGTAFDIGLRRHAPGILKGDLQLSVLPLRKDAPIYLAEPARAALHGADAVAVIEKIELIYRHETQLTAETEPTLAKPDFANPLARQRADPWIYRHTDGQYYLAATVPAFDRLELRSAPDLGGLSKAQPVTLWTQHQSGPMSAPIWAPELHFVDGKWYIYFAAGAPGGIRMFVLENAAADPLTGSWVEKGQLKTNWDSFSLDATTFEHRGRRYLVWAQQDPAIAGNTNLYIAEMDTPWSIKGRQVMISKPDLPWEQVLFLVNEGPAVLKRNGRIFITYSASGTDANYCMGMLTAPDSGDLLDAATWKKSPAPVFRTDASAGQYGPGHNCFTVLPDGQTDILVYHARNYENIIGDPLFDPNRHARAQVFRWKADGSPDFGTPVPDATPSDNPDLIPPRTHASH